MNEGLASLYKRRDPGGSLWGGAPCSSPTFNPKQPPRMHANTHPHALGATSTPHTFAGAQRLRPFRVGAAAHGQSHTHSFERARATSSSARALGFFKQHIPCTARSSSTIDASGGRAVCGEAQTLADSRTVSCWRQQTAERARAAAAAAHDDASYTRSLRACCYESARPCPSLPRHHKRCAP